MNQNSQKRGPTRLNRRTFLQLSAVAGATGLLAACSTPSAQPTAAPTAAATQAPKPAATAAPAAAAQPTAAPAKAAAKKNLIYGIFGGDPGNLSPVIRTDINAGIIQHNIYDNLVKPNYKTRVMEPLTVEAWENVDPLTWRVKIREGMKWQKGYGPVTAEDLVYSFDYHISSKSWQITTALFAYESGKVISPYVAEIKLKQPFGAFPGVVLGYGGPIVSKKAHEEMGPEKHSRNPIGNGPFQLDKWTAGSELVLKKNPDYWQKDMPYLEELVFRIIPDSHVRLQALDKGEIDFMTHPDAKDVADARKNANYVYSSTPGWNWDYQCFNQTDFVPKDSPWRKKEVRQAMSYAVDREAIQKEIYYGEATISDSPIPEGFLGFRPVPIKYPKNGDLKKAKELMAQAGVKGFDVEVITSDKDWLRRELELVAAMMSQIGVNFKIKNQDMGSFNNVWLNDKYQHLLEDITIVSPDPDSTVWWFLHTGARNASGYSVPEVDKWLDDARAEADPKKREPMYFSIVDRVLEDCPKIYHCHVNYVRLFKKGITGFEPSPQEYIEKFGNVRWEA
ncbi:MAG: ABC transporter substrate-binding protein [Chloroflexota bacterium]